MERRWSLGLAQVGSDPVGFDSEAKRPWMIKQKPLIEQNMDVNRSGSERVAHALQAKRKARMDFVRRLTRGWIAPSGAMVSVSTIPIGAFAKRFVWTRNAPGASAEEIKSMGISSPTR